MTSPVDQTKILFSLHLSVLDKYEHSEAIFLKNGIFLGFKFDLFRPKVGSYTLKSKYVGVSLRKLALGIHDQ